MKKGSEKLAEEFEIWSRSGSTMKLLGTCGQLGIDLIDEILEEKPGLAHGNAKKVRVIAVDDAEFSQWVRPGRGSAKAVRVDQVFDSAVAASRHLGYSYNDVGTRLSHARAQAEREAKEQYGRDYRGRLRPSVTIKGVTFQYEDDVKDA